MRSRLTTGTLTAAFPFAATPLLMPDLRLLFAIAVSLLLHTAILGGGVLKGLLKPTPPPVLHVDLRPLPTSIEPPPPLETLVKNTLENEPETPQEPPRAPPPALPPEPKAPPQATPKKPEKADKKQIKAAERKLAKHTFYPPEAVARGLEGDVRLIVVLSADGQIEDVQLAATSGHSILDNAAIKAAYAMGRLPESSGQQIILTAYFRLE